MLIDASSGMPASKCIGDIEREMKRPLPPTAISSSTSGRVIMLRSRKTASMAARTSEYGIPRMACKKSCSWATSRNPSSRLAAPLAVKTWYARLMTTMPMGEKRSSNSLKRRNCPSSGDDAGESCSTGWFSALRLRRLLACPSKRGTFKSARFGRRAAGKALPRQRYTFQCLLVSS